MSKLKYLATALVMTCIFLSRAAGVWAVPGTVIGNVKFRYPPNNTSAATIPAGGQIVSKQGGQFYSGVYQAFEGSVSSRTDNQGRYIFANNPEERINSGDASTAAKNYMYYLCAWLHEDNASGATRCADRAIDQTYISCINSSCSNINLTAYSTPQVAGYDGNDPRFDDECWNYRRNSNNEIIGGNNIGNWCGGNCDGRISQQYLFVRNSAPPSGYRIKQKQVLPWSGGGNVDNTPVLFTGQNGGTVNPADIIIDIEPIPIIAACGSANGVASSTLSSTSANLCAPGNTLVENSFSSIQTTQYTWSCQGVNTTPLTVACSAPKPAICGAAASATATYTQPTDNLCSVGTLVSPPGVSENLITHDYVWTCANGTNNTANCTVPHKINGVCGTASSTTPYATTVSSYPPNSTSCGTGTPSPSPVPFPAPGATVNWTCLGINGGTNATSCSASRNITCYRCTAILTDGNANETTTNTLSCATGWSTAAVTNCPIGSPAMTLLKDVKGGTATDYLPADTATGPKPIIDASAQVQYRFTAENTGNVTLTNVAITDQLDTANGHLTLSNFVCNVGNQSRSMPTTLGIGEKLICTASAINGVLEGDIQNTATLNAKYNNVALTPVTNPAHYDSRKLACQAACTQSAQCTTNYCSPTTHKCVNEAYPTSTDCQTTPAQALLTEKRIISMVDTLDGSRTISYMITVKNISTTEDVENVQITDDLENNAATGPVTLVPGSLYGINLRSAQISTTFNGVTNKEMLAVNAGTTNLTLKKYPSSESYASVIYAVTYPLGTRSSVSVCDKAVVTGTNVISRFGSTSSDIKCIDITATPSPSPTTPPPPPPTVSPSPTTITPSVTIPPVTPTLTPTPAKIDLKLIKSVDKSKIKIGDRVEFTITIANESAVGALNVKVKDLLTSSFAYLSHETSYGQYDQASGIWTIGNLNALSTQTLKIKALVVSRDALTNLAEVFGAEQQDSDSSPNNCDGGKNKEDDCADVSLTYDGVVAGITTKGGTLADTGNSLIAPLVFGVLGFGALFIVLKLRSKHTLIIKVSNPGTDSAARELLSRLLVHQTIAGGVVVASALLVGVSILNVANTVQIAQLKRATGGLDSSLTMVGAEVVPIEKSVTFDCGVASPTEILMTKDTAIRLTMVNSNADAHAFTTLPGYDTLTQSATINQQDANDDFIYEVSGEKAITFVPKTTGTWYLTNASYCKKANKTNSFNIPTLIVGTDIPTPSPVEVVVHEAWYKMDETSGTVASDSSGNGHNATLSSPNGPTWTTGHTGNGLQFDGVDDWVGASTGPVPVTNLTYEAWVKTTDTDGAIMEAVGTVNPQYSDGQDRNLCLAGGQLTHRIYDDETIGSTTLINDGSWHFVAATMSATNQHILYVDGVQVAQGTKGVSDVANEAGYVIGRGPQCGPLTGTIDDVRIYNTARTPAQIYEDYVGSGGLEQSKKTVAKASAAFTHTCAILTSGKLFCWGDYWDNPNGIPVDRFPEQLTQVVAVATGDLHTCAIQSGGDLYCWGASNTEHQSSVPDAIAHGAESVASFWTHTCAIKTGGKLYCWGRYDYDQNRPADVPEDLANLTFNSVSTGTSHSCAIQSGGQLHCWGDNSHHQTEVPEGLSNVTVVTTGDYHTCAIRSDGKLFCWGVHSPSQNGPADIPTDLVNATFTAVAAGIDHTCAIQTGGQLHCWGDNSYHQTDVPEEVTNAVSVIGGQYHTCAIQSGGKLYCWGSNDYGQTTIPPELISRNSQSSAKKLINDNKKMINRRLKK